MKLKISSVRDIENISKLIEILSPLYLAFDFRATSPRYLGELDEAILTKIPHKIRKIAIFDDSSPLYISYITGRFALNGAQIEGDVPIQTFEILAAEGLEIIKRINRVSDIEKYEGLCNNFLFRDKKLFENYSGKTPSIVSWDIYEGQKGIHSVDTCEDFEIRDALKDCEKIENWYKNIV